MILNALKLDLVLIHRYNIAASALVVTTLFTLLFLFLPAAPHTVLITLIYGDAAGLGMTFTGALYLFERSENTVQAMGVTSLQPWQYLISRTLSLTGLAVMCSLVLGIAAFGLRFNIAFFVASITLSATLLTFLGMAAAVHCRTFNEYMLKMGAILAPVMLPLLNLFNVTDTLWWYLSPVQAGLLLMKGAFEWPESWELAYALCYLLLWNVLAFKMALDKTRQAFNHSTGWV